MSKIDTIVDLQNELNIQTAGKDWTKGYTKEGRKINWFRAITLEVAEAIDSLNWKHWKDISQPHDLENLKIELVDILHFIISQKITDYGLEKAKELLNNATSLFLENQEILMGEELKKIDPEDITVAQLLENIIKKTIQNKNAYYEFLIATGYLFDINEILNIYIGKNVLNKFRQEHGYKEGHYKKIWNGKEDNVVMLDFINKNPNITAKELYNKLEEEYKKIQ